jgi:hypothetical protein
MTAWKDEPELRLSRRIGVLVLALLQLGAAVALPAVDGVLDVELYGVPTHVESPESDDCTPHHDHAFCQVVRATALATPSRVPATVALGQPLTGFDALPASPELRRSTRLLQGSSGPRAPPSA